MRTGGSIEVSRILVSGGEGKLWKEPDLSTGGWEMEVWGWRSFRTVGFVMLKATHARSLLHLDTGISSAALGIDRDGKTCT